MSDRWVVENPDKSELKFDFKKYYIVGLNALNACEKKFFSHLQKKQKTVQMARQQEKPLSGSINQRKINIQKLSGGMEIDTDRPGMDYKNFFLSVADPEVCQKACKDDSKTCKAWTYVKPGVQGSQARCWLKNAVPAVVSNTCCISGVMK